MSRLAGLLLVVFGCGPATSVPDPTPWRLVQTRCLGAAQDVAPRVQAATGLQVLRGPVDDPVDWYCEAFGDTRKAGPPVRVSGTSLAPGRWLVCVRGAADWWDNTQLIVLLERDGDRSLVRAVNLSWSADMPACSGWAAIDGEMIRIDDRSPNEVRLAFRLTGDIEVGSAASGERPMAQRTEGAVRVSLVPGALAPPDPLIVETLGPFLSTH